MNNVIYLLCGFICQLIECNLLFGMLRNLYNTRKFHYNTNTIHAQTYAGNCCFMYERHV